MNCRLLLQTVLFTVLPTSLMAAPELQIANSDPSLPSASEFHYSDHISAIRHRLTIQDKPAVHSHKKKLKKSNAPEVTAPDTGKSTAQPQYLLSFDHLSDLSKVSEFQIRAALRLHKKIAERKLRLIDYVFTDANDDGKLDLVSLSRTRDVKSRQQIIIGVFEIDSDANPILRYEKAQTTDSGSLEKYSQSIFARSPGFTLCEDWKIASWNIHECHDLKLSSTWEPGVLAHFIQTSEPRAHSVQSNSFDFERRTASRNYERIPDGPFMPPLRRQSTYAMMFASRDNTLPEAPASLNATNSAAFTTSDHAPIQYAASWNPSGLNLSFVLTDTDVQTAACSDQMSLQQTDHLELWFDLNASLGIRRENPQSWLLEYEKNYQNEPYRHALDADIFGIAVLPSGCIVPMAPTRSNWPVLPKISTQTLPWGYRVDVFVPASFFGTTDMSTIDRALGLGFTARQHDLHTDAPYDSIATSDWQWPDPYTFGQIWMLSPSSAFPPPFPLQWNTWLLDN